MRVQDADNIFDFLAKLDLLGTIGIISAVTLISAFLVVGIIEKLYDAKKFRRLIIYILIPIVVGCMALLKVEADKRQQQLYKANNIKAYMVEHGELSCGFNELASSVYFPFEDQVNNQSKKEKRILEIRQLIELFPEEFKPTGVPYPNFNKDDEGLGLVNPTTIQPLIARNEKLYPFFKGKILNFMRGKLWDTLNYRYIRSMIDTRCDDHTLDQLISKNSNLFVSIYAPYNIYEEHDRENNDGWTYALRINPDSITRVFGNKKLRYMK